jgi:hypothetical protein
LEMRALPFAAFFNILSHLRRRHDIIVPAYLMCAGARCQSSGHRVTSGQNRPIHQGGGTGIAIGENGFMNWHPPLVMASRVSK